MGEHDPLADAANFRIRYWRCQREPHAVSSRRHPETSRHDAHDGKGVAVQMNNFADCAGITSQLRFPERVAHYRRMPSAGAKLVDGESAAEGRLEIEEREELGRNPRGLQAHRFLETGKRYNARYRDRHPVE